MRVEGFSSSPPRPHTDHTEPTTSKNNNNNTQKNNTRNQPTKTHTKKDRNCYTADAMYSVLIQGNSQGPPSTTPCRCKDPAQTIGAPAPVPAPAVYYDALPNTDIPGNDIGCNGQAYCKVCGDVAAVQAACSKNSACAGFTYGASEKCGYLKSKSPPFRSGWTAYRRKP